MPNRKGEIMEKLKQENVHIEFSSADEMKNYLGEMESSDVYIPLRVNTISTGTDEEGNLFLKGADTNTGEMVTIPLWPFSIKSLEKRSGDNATGHSLMTNEQILNSMNNYWGLHSKKKEAVARIRGEKMMGLGSEQYESISQKGLLEVTEKWLQDRHEDEYTFASGEYTHLLTTARYVVNDAITPSYKAAWRTAGLPENLLQQSNLVVDVYTDDTAECSAKAIVHMNVGGSMFLIGNPILIEHRNGYGGLESFEKELSKLDITIKDELDSLSKLMSVTLIHPKEAAITALKKAKIDKLSKKACKELVDDMMLTSGESAYIVYLCLHGILDTFNGARLNDERKLRVVTALRTLLKEDWSKMDVPSASL